MTTGLRRIFVTALLGALVGLGLVAVLFGRRPRTGAATEIAAPPPAPSSALPPPPPPALTLPPVLPPPARTRGRGRIALAAGLAVLLLLGGGILASRDLLFGPGPSAPDGGRPLTALSPPQAGLGEAPAPRAEAPVANPSQPDRPAVAEWDAFDPPEGQERQRRDAGDAAASPLPPRMKADATAPRGSQDPSDPVAARARAAPERGNGPPSSASSSHPAGMPRSSDRLADAAEPFPHAPAKVGRGEAAEVGRLLATGRTGAGTGLRLVLNDPRIAPATLGRDGTVAFGVGREMRPGAETVRLDAAAGRLRERTGLPLAASVPQRDGDLAARRKDPSEPDDRQPLSTGSLGTGALPRTGAGDSKVGISKARVSGLTMIRVTRGDTLWSISRRTYGKGRRYTLIHEANPDRVRDPDRIRPGQILVLPRRAAKRG